MKKFFFLVFICLCFILKVNAQTYLFSNESKMTKQKKVDKWQTKLTYNYFEFNWCDIYPKTHSCFNIEKKYKLEKTNDTIFIKSVNSEYKLKIHPQYSIKKKDTLFFLDECIEGLKNGSIIGRIVFIKDTILTFNHLTFDCYLFKRFSASRDREDIENIYMDKKTLITVLSNTYYINHSRNKVVKSAYVQRKLKKII